MKTAILTIAIALASALSALAQTVMRENSTVYFQTNVFLHDDSTNALHSRIADVEAGYLRMWDGEGAVPVWGVVDPVYGFRQILSDEGNNIFFDDGDFIGDWNFVDTLTVRGSKLLLESTLLQPPWVSASAAYTNPIALPHQFTTNGSFVDTAPLPHSATRVYLTTTNDESRSSGALRLMIGDVELASYTPACDGTAQQLDFSQALVPTGSSLRVVFSAFPGAPGITSSPPTITDMQVWTMADPGQVGRRLDTANSVYEGDDAVYPRQWLNLQSGEALADAALAAANAETHARTAPTDLQGQPVRWNPRFDTVTETNQISWKYGGETYWSVDGEGATVIPEIRSFTVGGGETATLTVWSYSGGATNLIPEVSTNLQTWVRLETNAIVSAEMVDDFTAQVVFTNAAETAMFVRLVDVSGGEGRTVIYAHAQVVLAYGSVFPATATNCYLRPGGGTNSIYFDEDSNMVIAVDGSTALTISPAGDVGVGQPPLPGFSLSTDASFYAGGSVRAGAGLASFNGKIYMNNKLNSYIELVGTNLMFTATNGVTGRIQMIYE